MIPNSSNIRVGIDIRKYFDYGIGTYLQNLIIGLEELRGFDGTYFASDDIRDSVHGSIRGPIIPDNSPKYSLQELFSLSGSANRQDLDLFHAPHYTLPLRLTMPSVVTVHDIIHLRMKKYFSLPQRMYARMMIGHACRNSSAIIVVSEFTKQELINVFDVPEQKINVIYNGVHGSFSTAVTDFEQDAFRKKIGINGLYILYTGSVKPHKNVPVLLKAFAKLRRDFPVQLVMSGERSAMNPELQHQIDHLQLQDSIVETGRITESELRAAYQSAEAVVLPSVYEGFGLSMVEAMASGTPAVGARTSSITEIVGDAGLLFDPHDDEELVLLLRSVMSDGILRSELCTKGKKRAEQFSWKDCAERTMNVYQRILK
ncbi:MAG: glycosyltransferase family 4 protein [Bacteroidota bacterium]